MNASKSLTAALISSLLFLSPLSKAVIGEEESVSTELSESHLREIGLEGLVRTRDSDSAEAVTRRVSASPSDLAASAESPPPQRLSELEKLTLALKESERRMAAAEQRAREAAQAARRAEELLKERVDAVTTARSQAQAARSALEKANGALEKSRLEVARIKALMSLEIKRQTANEARDRYNKLVAAAKSVKDDVRKLTVELENLRKQVAAAESIATKAGRDLATLRDSLAAAVTEKEQAGIAVAKTEGFVAMTNEAFEKLQTAAEEFDDEEIEGVSAQLESMLAKRKAALTSLRQDFSEKDKAAAALMERLTSAESSAQEKQQALAIREQQAAELTEALKLAKANELSINDRLEVAAAAAQAAEKELQAAMEESNQDGDE